jgi:lysophospholipase L1-like esterase
VLIIGDSIVRDVGSEYSDMKVERFRALERNNCIVTENRDLGNPDTVVIHVGLNDLRRTGNPDCVMGDVYDLVNTAKTKFSTSRVVLSGVLWGRDVSWRRICAVNSRYVWVANALGVTSVDPNIWVDDWDFGRDGLHINRRGARYRCQIYSRVCVIGGGRQ